jgi:hypothetical protein
MANAYRTGFRRQIHCLTLQEISANIPTAPVERSSLKIPEDIQLADPRSDVPDKVDMLIGADVFWDLFTGRTMPIKTSRATGTVLHETKLGWILVGTVSSKIANRHQARCNVAVSDIISSQLEKFWKMEELETTVSSPNEERCEETFKETVGRTASGRYIVGIPMKQPHTPLGASRTQALQRFYMMESKLNKDISLKRQYIDFMDEYQLRGHMERLTSGFDDDGGDVFYLPHHPVLKEDSTTTKLRVVYDASAKTSTGGLT